MKGIRAEVSPGLVSWMIRHRVSLVSSACRTGQLLFIGARSSGAAVFSAARFPGAMGLAAFAQRIYLAGEASIFRLENALRPDELVDDQFDRLFVPRNAQLIGNVNLHELAIQPSGRIIFVNTRHSCLATVSMSHAFQPVWKPSWISRLAPEDRCHLNGLALEGNRVRYVTAFARTDVVDGWREHRDEGGVLVDLATDRVVADGLSMPHSPRLHGGFVWLCDSGTGHLARIDPRSGRRENVAFCPGLPRGIAFVGNYAVVGLSLPRHGRFQGLALDEGLARRNAEPWCGLVVVDLRHGNMIEWVRFGDEVIELFDVAALPARCPMAVSPGSPEMQDAITFEPDFAPLVQTEVPVRHAVGA